MRKQGMIVLLVLALALSTVAATGAQEQAGNVTPVIGRGASESSAIPRVQTVNDEGGPVVVVGSVTYTNRFFTDGVAQPLVILEDQAGFVDRNRFFIMPPESQVMGQITSDFYTSPFTYSISLPIEPQGTLRDVDHDGAQDTGVMVFTPAYWTNTFGDPFLEERDLYGGGWSTAYAGTRINPNPNAEDEVIGGKYVVYAPDDQQGFPTGFGPDGLLFTEDDPIAILPQGYTVVDLDTDPFTFDRSRRAVIDLIEGERSAADDFSSMSYTRAFDAMIDLFRREYAFTEYKGLDWDAISATFRPRFEAAESSRDIEAYRKALFEFVLAVPDGHVGTSAFPDNEFAYNTEGSIGIAFRDVDDGRVLVNYVVEGSPADEAGMVLGTEIIAINGIPIDEWVEDTLAYSGPFSSPHVERLQKLRYASRFPLSSEVEVTFQNPGDAEPTTMTFTPIPERESWTFSSFNVGRTGFELPVDYRILDSGYGYVKIDSFSDNEVLTVQLWERMIRAFNNNGVPGVIIDMRQNGGGSGFLADQMAAYFFDEQLTVGNTGFYDEELGAFYFDERGANKFYPPAEDLRYHGQVAVLVGPNCNSACEFFSYDMTVQDRAAIVGQYPTAGLGGSVAQFIMPEGEIVQYTIGRAVDAEGNIHIEGKGVAPTVQVPVNEETLFSEGDPVLDAAVAYLDGATAVEIIPGGALAIGDSASGTLEPGVRVQYELAVEEGDFISIFLGDETGDLDTVLRIYDIAGNLLLENDDANDSTFNSAFEELEIPGGFDTLILEAATYNDASTGAFTLEVVDLTGE
ncbi:MAG: hypothetical protein Kow00120_26880 [Anaerolineae bacterium]